MPTARAIRPDEPGSEPELERETPMQVFLTGATGYIGSAVAEELVKKGHEVLALARSSSSAKKLKARGYDVVRGDLRDALGLAQAALTADGVIHTAFSNTKDGPKVDAEATTAILLALENSGKPFIYTSGVWVYGDTGDTPVHEEDSLDPPPAVAWRVEVEEKVLRAVDRGVGAVVIRPGIVYGDGDGGGLLEAFRKEAQVRGSFRVVEDGSQRWAFVHRRDLADLYEKALQADPGSVFNGTDGTAPPVKELGRVLSASAGGVREVLAWPLEEARDEIGGLAEALALDQGNISSERAASELDWVPQQAPVLSEVLPPCTQGAPMGPRWEGNGEEAT
jgi:nucleoside-diphosphate-sugar epimerase